MRASVLALVLACASAEAQAPAKPAVGKPVTSRPPAAASGAPAANLSSLKAELGTVNARIDALKRKRPAKDSISAMNQEDMRILQELMDRKSQLESMISAAMKAGSGTSQPIAPALKDS